MRHQILPRLTIALVLVSVVCLISACREGCYVAVEQPANGAPVFHLKKDLNAAEDGVEISGFVVLRKANGRYQPVWEIATSDQSKPLLVKSITYGIVPHGFEKSTQAVPLLAGEVYDVMASRPGMVGGEVFVRAFNKEHSGKGQ